MKHIARYVRVARLHASNLARLSIHSFLSEWLLVYRTVHVTNVRFPRIYEAYSFSVIPMLGSILASDRESYQYLVESIRRFPSQPEFAKMIALAGFKTGELHEGDGGAWRDLWGGIASIHTGTKPL